MIMTPDVIKTLTLLCLIHQISTNTVNKIMVISIPGRRTDAPNISATISPPEHDPIPSTSLILNDPWKGHDREYITHQEKQIFFCVSNCLKIFFNSDPPKQVEATTTKPPTRAPQCMKYECKMDIKRYSKKRGKPAVRIGKGHFLSNCKTDYFFSTERLFSMDAKKACCKMNMRMAILDTPAKFACIEGLTKNPLLAHLKLSWHYLVDGSDLNSIGKFVWCDSGTPFRKDVPWKAGELTISGAETCVTVFVESNGVANLTDTSCYFATPYLCEAPTIK